MARRANLIAAAASKSDMRDLIFWLRSNSLQRCIRTPSIQPGRRSGAPLGPGRRRARFAPALGGALIAIVALTAAGGGTAHGADAAPQIIRAPLIKDKIEAILHPKFVAARDAATFEPRDRVIGVVVGDVAKAYPLRILRWHEVINDVTAGRPIAITYCPLTGDAAVYVRKMGGKTVTLYPTDKLYESTTLLRDSATGSLWSQFNGKAIIGPARGKQLVQLASINTNWALWQAYHPKTLIMSTDTGFARNYEVDPYGLYEGPGATEFPVSHKDPRLPRDELVLGVEVDHHAEAFPLRRLAIAKTPMTTRLGGKEITVVFDPNTATVGAADEQHHLPAYTGQWFGWAAFHPDSAIWGKEPPKPPPPPPIIFTDAGDLNRAREGNSATLLKNGKVLIAGGDNGRAPMIAAAELYDPAKRTFTITGDMKTPRGGHVATLLADGRVLMTGGMDNLKVIAAAEVYDPATGQFSAVAPMHAAREKHTATLLKDGRVLIAGGYPGDAFPTATTELFDPAQGKFIAGPPMTAGRQNHTATLLPDGRVLVVGGTGDKGPLSSAEIYNPHTGRFSPAGTMHAAREGHSATLLQDGKVLIAGGAAGAIAAEKSAELYDPATQSFTPVGDLEVAREGHRALLLPNGEVLVVGGSGLNPQHRYLASVEIYNPATRRFKLLGEMLLPRFGPTLTLLGNGQVLVTGRFSAPGYFATATAELYQPPAKPD